MGYGTQTRAELSTSVSSVGAADLAGQPIASVDGALQGKAPGVQVIQNAGNPGNAISVRVRGSASISASNDPLYVVDGVPMIVGESEPARTWAARASRRSAASAPTTSRRIDVLKDAAATADLRLARLQRRGADHHQAGRVRAARRSTSTATSAPSRRLAGCRCSTPQQYLEFFNESAANDGYDAEPLRRARRGRPVPTPTGRTRCSARRR